MFNPEKLLGGLLRSGMRGRGLGSLVSGGAALGLVGVAMEAVEHYMNRPQSTSQNTPPPAPGSSNISSTGSMPPPPPAPSAVPPPVPEAGNAAPDDAMNQDAVLLIRAMIAAANADGMIDAQERGRILDKLKSVDLSNEERQFIIHELLEPKPVQEIIDAVDRDELARQVYAASIMAITIDTDAEKVYLKDLSKGLGLGANDVEDIHRQLKEK
ncbi:MAG: tellurite resistance TerB family protein [Desulfobacteraceae bacterium]|jgi:uncharacterized membrane protein YebE (DUF533 family)